MPVLRTSHGRTCYRLADGIKTAADVSTRRVYRNGVFVGKSVIPYELRASYGDLPLSHPLYTSSAAYTGMMAPIPSLEHVYATIPRYTILVYGVFPAPPSTTGAGQNLYIVTNSSESGLIVNAKPISGYWTISLAHRYDYATRWSVSYNLPFGNKLKFIRFFFDKSISMAGIYVGHDLVASTGAAAFYNALNATGYALHGNIISGEYTSAPATSYIATSFRPPSDLDYTENPRGIFTTSRHVIYFPVSGTVSRRHHPLFLLP